MTTVAQFKIENQEIGDLLLKVQDELRGLRNMVSQEKSKIDIVQLQQTIQKTESDIKEKTDHFINQLNSQVKTLPSIEEHELPTSKYGASLESLWDITKKERKSDMGAIRASSQQLSAHPQQRLLENRPQSNTTNGNFLMIKDSEAAKEDQIIEEMQELANNSVNQNFSQYDLSPGQQVKVSRETRALFNPQNARNRIALNENYNIQLPLIEKRKSFKMQTHLITGSTVEHLSTLPLAYRRNPTLLPPPITENDSKYGLLSLLERGLIPSTAKITFDQFPISAKTFKRAESSKFEDKMKEYAKVNSETQIALIKMDPNFKKTEYTQNEKNETKKSENGLGEKNSRASRLNKSNNAKSSSQTKLNRNSASLNHFNNQSDLQPPPATPLATLQIQLYDSSKFIHRFVIQNGRVRTDMHDYSSFKQSYILRWGSIATIIKYLEDLCQTYTVPAGLLDGLKVSELSRCIDMDLKPSLDELLDCFLNKEDVEKLVKAPGRKFKRKGGHNLAAIRIQCAWRRYRDRSSYLEYRKRKWAAGVIALTWLTYVKIGKARIKLKETRAKQLENFRLRQKEFQKMWPRIKTSKRVIIHIPSLGYDESIRGRMRDLTVKENYQMARLCDIMDDNVDVIYISSIPITEETLQYYSKLFGLRPAIISGNASDQVDVSNRYKIVIPEALNSFPTHNMALSTLLKYSPRSMERIKNLIKGRDAYIVPGVMSHDDIFVSDLLEIPILGSEPEIANLYTTKSGSKRIFQSSNVDMPFGEFDIYNKEQLYETLAEAITANLMVQRWLFKLDEESDGRGIAYCDISTNLKCYNWALKEMTKFGDKWGKRWAYEPTYVKILEEIPGLLSNHAKVVNTGAYKTWDIFLKAFLSQGGILEAHPPSDNVTSVTVSILIEPDLNIKIISSGDHVHAESQYSCWGYTYPQTSIDSKTLNEMSLRIAESCKNRNIIGYLDIDFVTFIDMRTDTQVIWATDLNISYCDTVAMSRMLLYITDGKFDSIEHNFEVPILSDISKSKKSKLSANSTSKKEITQETGTRYAVISTKLNHSNLSVIHYSVFFQTCRALGIGYDIKEKQGTVFSLIDSIQHVNLGMITITDNLQSAMQQFSQNLNSLHKEISSTNMQGKTNFLLAAQDIKKVLSLTEESSTNEESSSVN